MRKEKSDALDAALRAEPEYRELCELLDKQSAARKERLALELTTSQPSDYSQSRGARTMESTARAIDERIMALKEGEGLSFTQVAERLTTEGYRNQAGGQFTRAAVSKRYYRLKDRALSQGPRPREDVAEPGAAPESGPVEGMPSGEPCGTCEPEKSTAPLHDVYAPSEPCEPSQLTLSCEVIAELRKIVREEIASIMPQVASTANAAINLPPRTPKAKGSKRLQGERVTLPGTRIDKALGDLFESERANLAISASELMQRLLWEHFGKPRLSFEEADEPTP